MASSPSTAVASPRASSDLPAPPNFGAITLQESSEYPVQHNVPTASLKIPSNSRRYFLLFLFAMAQFMDVYSASAVIVGIPRIAKDLDMRVSESVWMINAYSLTLAAFLLTAGRISDIWSNKWVFVIGFAWVGVFSLGIGFVQEKTTMFVLRAFSGIGASLTIPSALSLIVHLFPEPREQAIAIAIFGGSGAVANVIGLILGGALLLAKWTWIFFFVALVVLPLSFAAAILIPAPHIPTVVVDKSGDVVAERKPEIDYAGTILLTAAIVLFIYGLTEGSSIGWTNPGTLSTLIIGFLLFPAFFLWELRMDPRDALIIPSTWVLPNFTLITVFSLVPSFWFYAVQVALAAIFQDEWNLSPIMTSVRFIPAGVSAGAMVFFCGSFPLKYFPLRWRLVVGGILGGTGSLLLSFVREPSDFWRLVFPALIIGCAGCAMVFVSSNIAIVMAVKPEHAGVAGGVFNSVTQLGATIGLAIVTTIQTSFLEPGLTTPSHKGYQSSFFFMMSVMLSVSVLALLVFRDPLASRPRIDRTATLVEASSTEKTLVEASSTEKTLVEASSTEKTLNV